MKLYLDDRFFHGTEEEFLDIKDGFTKKTFTRDDNKYHRIDGPAVIYSDGSLEWFKDGYYHRDNDEPARILSNGKEWYQNGLYHRENGPAIIRSDGYQAWYQNGKKHRDVGPAIIRSDGWLEWWIDGNRHRIDGPAVVYPRKNDEWHIYGDVAKNLITNANYIKEKLGINILEQDCMLEINRLSEELQELKSKTKEIENVSQILKS